MKKSKRRQLIVDKKLQYSFIFYNILYYVITVLVFACVIFLPLMLKLKHPGPEINEYLVETAHNILYLNSLFWPAALALFVIISSHVIYTTHKIAGPIYRFRKVITQVANGDVSQNFAIRKGDYLTKEARCLNEMIDEIRHVLSDIKDKHGKVAKNLAEIVQSPEADCSDEMVKKIKVIEESCRLVGSKLDYFKV